MLLWQAELSHDEYWLKATDRIKMHFFTPVTESVQWKQPREYGEHRSLTVRVLFMWIQKYRPHDLKPTGRFLMLFRRLVFALEICALALAKCLTCEWSDQTVHHAMKTTERHTRVPSPFTHTHGHTQLLEPLELQTESRGYLQTARTNIRFIFVPTTSSNNMLMSAFSMSRLLQCNKAKNYSALNCGKILKKAQSQIIMHHEDRGRDTNVL